MSISRRLAELALGTPTITNAASKAARKLVLDTTGTTIAGYNQPGIQPVLDQMLDWGGKAESHVLVRGGALPAPNAAFVNSAMSHALDFDDGHMPGGIHIMCTLFPVALAAAGIAGSSGNDFLEAIIMGVEVSGRLGIAYRERREHTFFLPATIIGGFGAVAGACRLLGLSEEQTVSAFGIYYAQTSGNRQALVELTLTKRIQPGLSARSALWAAMLAARGITGPEQAFEGPGGLFKLYGTRDVPTEQEILAPRDFFEVERTSIKRYPTCGAQQGAILAAIDLANDHDLDPENIAEVELYLGEGGGDPMVSRPFKAGSENPQVDAQFCAPYGVVLGLVRRHVRLSDITNEQIRKDVQVAELAERVKIIKHWDFEPEEPPPNARLPAWCYAPRGLRVRTRDGQTLECLRLSVEVYDPEQVSYEDVAEKFRTCASFSGVCPAERADRIIAAVKNIEQASSMSEFIKKELVLL